MQNNKRIVKNRTANVIFLVLLSVHFQIQGKEKQKIHFTNANRKNEKVSVPYLTCGS